MNNCRSNNIRIGGICTRQSDILAKKVDVFLIKAELNENNIAITAIVYSCLDVVKIRRVVVINSDYFCLTRDCQQANPDENQLFRFLSFLNDYLVLH